MKSRTQKRREKRQEELEKVQPNSQNALFAHSLPNENYIKERNETQMENKKPTTLLAKVR